MAFADGAGLDRADSDLGPAGLGLAAAEFGGGAAAVVLDPLGGAVRLLIERFHMAGEWVIGGVEAKGFAYVLVFLGLEAVVRNRWNRAWLLLGGGGRVSRAGRRLVGRGRGDRVARAAQAVPAGEGDAARARRRIVAVAAGTDSVAHAEPRRAADRRGGARTRSTSTTGCITTFRRPTCPRCLWSVSWR